MTVTSEYIKQIERRYGTTNGKELGRLLGVAEMSISRYRKESHGFADDVAVRAAQLLDIDPGVILAELQIERAPEGIAKEMWSKVLKQLTAAGMTAVVLMTPSLLPNDANARQLSASSLYIMSTRVRALLNRFFSLRPGRQLVTIGAC